MKKTFGNDHPLLHREGGQLPDASPGSKEKGCK